MCILVDLLTFCVTGGLERGKLIIDDIVPTYWRCHHCSLMAGFMRSSLISYFANIVFFIIYLFLLFPFGTETTQ